MENVIKDHKIHFEILLDGRCKCRLNGHVFPANAQAVTTFISGQKYRQLCAKEEERKDLQQFEPYLTPSKNFPERLFCRLTCQLLKKDLKAVDKFMRGKKYQYAKDLHSKGEHELMSEPDLESDEGEEHAEESEQTRQEHNGAAASPRDSVQKGSQFDHDLHLSNPEDDSMDIDTRPGSRIDSSRKRVRPPRPKRRKAA